MYMNSFVWEVESADNRYVFQILNCIFILNMTCISSHQTLRSLVVRKKEFQLKETRSATMNIFEKKIILIICKSRIKLCFHYKYVQYS